MVCKALKNEHVEQMVTDKVCSKQKKVPVDVCDTALEKVWETLSKKACSNSTLTSMPPQVCKVLQNEDIEENAIDTVCSKQKFVPAKACENEFEKLWETVSNKECTEKTLTAMPPMVCKVLQNEDVEEE